MPRTEKTPGGVRATMVSTLSLTRLFFKASEINSCYIPPMEAEYDLTVEARQISLIWEDHTYYPDGTQEIDYRTENLVVLVPKFRRCRLLEPLLAHFRWN